MASPRQLREHSNKSPFLRTKNATCLISFIKTRPQFRIQNFSFPALFKKPDNDHILRSIPRALPEWHNFFGQLPETGGLRPLASKLTLRMETSCPFSWENRGSWVRQVPKWVKKSLIDTPFLVAPRQSLIIFSR